MSKEGGQKGIQALQGSGKDKWAKEEEVVVVEEREAFARSGVTHDQEPDLGEDPPDEVREEDQDDNDEEEGGKEVAEMVYQLTRLAVGGRVEQTVHEDVEVDPGHKDSGKEVLLGEGRVAGRARDGA
ncbi:hypothetical protein C8F04DRAFT_1176430 [Mycena alexandri]|uniref:Uncharacterized protein n=1 Tax=Mycena alexandri TaxID=1745969 RepID=A0AAD6T9J6_9AGAR|nr:hypothetical protein C8F04DRAFT_1176430 [Mycena alexandri]